MTRQYFLRQIEYDLWANLRTLASLQTASPPPERCIELFSHIIAAHNLWHARMSGRDYAQLPVWPRYEPDDLEDDVNQVYDNWRNFIHDIDEDMLDIEKSYHTSAGTPYVNCLDDVLTHVLLHTAYHRGQIATILKDAGHTPAVTDYIAFVR